MARQVPGALPGGSRDAIAERLGEIAAEAGRLVAAVEDRRVGHHLKEDGSPATSADLDSERLILRRLAEAWPDIPAVAEESPRGGGRHDVFFLVDPLDGTRDYLAGEAEYSVNIALVSGDRPVAAALCAPGLGMLWIAGEQAYAGSSQGGERERRPAKVRPAPAEGLVALVSRRHGDPATAASMAALPIARLRTASSAAKFGLIASGDADLYVRCGPTMEWDTAAGDHIVTCAGGMVFGPDGAPLSYGHAERRYLNGPFAALGDPAYAGRVRLPTQCA